MDAAMVSSVISSIPERVARALSGAVFAPSAPPTCRHPERIARIGQLLHWLSPLNAIGKDDQTLLGLLNAAGRPMHAADLEDESEELETAEATPQVEEEMPA